MGHVVLVHIPAVTIRGLAHVLPGNQVIPGNQVLPGNGAGLIFPDTRVLPSNGAALDVVVFYGGGSHELVFDFFFRLDLFWLNLLGIEKKLSKKIKKQCFW